MNSPAPSAVGRLPVGRLAAFVIAGWVVGLVSGVVWWLVVRLPAYRVGADGGATINERGLAAVFAADAWFCLIGAVVGLVLGVVAWRLFRRAGWVVALAVAVAALGAALTCWAVGYGLGPGGLDRRLAEARPGDQVPIALTVRAKASLVVWPFVAVIPVLVGASLGREEDEHSGDRRESS